MSSHPEAVRSRQRRARESASQSQARREANTCTLQRARKRLRLTPPPSPPLASQSPAAALMARWLSFSRSRPRAIANPWRRDPCRWCGALLLTSEDAGWCCHKGTRRLDPLPPLPPTLGSFVQQFPADAADCSRSLNYLFNFSAQGVSGGIVRFHAPYSLCITGRTYHRILPTRRGGHPVNWFIHDPIGADNATLRACIEPAWITAIRDELLAQNPLFRHFEEFENFSPETDDASMQLLDPGASNEIAAIYYLGPASSHAPRSLFVRRSAESGPTPVSILSSFYETLQYPILFPQGTGGWGEAFRHPSLGHWTQIQWYKCRLLTEPRFQQFCRLGSEWIIDMFSRVEDQRLHAIRMGKEAELACFQQAQDLDADDSAPSYQLPSSFTGSAKYYAEKVADSLALARHLGKPDLMITLTCNPHWPELHSQLGPGQTASTVPHLTVWVFKARLYAFFRHMKELFGGIDYFVSVIEFQKRGLPHAHIVVKLQNSLQFEHIDHVVSAEVPRQPGRLRELVLNHMTHRSDHLDTRHARTSCCNRRGTCIYGYPHPVISHTQLNDKQRVSYRRRSADDAWVVPFCPPLLLLWEGHANAEVVFTADVFLYLFKYLFKGVDYAKFQITTAVDMDASEQYVQGRYLSAPEAAWRIFAFDICRQEPSVSCLKIHEPSKNRRQYSFGQAARCATPSEGSDLICYFNRPTDPLFDDLKFVEFFEQFSHRAIPTDGPLPASYWPEATLLANIPPRIIIRRRSRVIAHVQSVRPGMGEVFYIRALLYAFPARSFESLRTVDGTLHPSFQLAAKAAGLFANESEGLMALEDAVASFKSPTQLRLLFVLLILEGSPAEPMWERFGDDLARDYGGNVNGPVSQQAKDRALCDIQQLLDDKGRSTEEFGLPSVTIESQEISAQLDHFLPLIPSLRALYESYRATFTPEQELVFNSLFHAVYDPRPGSCKLFFLTGRAGRGKTRVSEALIHYARSHGQLPFVVGATALAASNYDRAWTAHSGYQIPVVKDFSDVVSALQPFSKRADLICRAPFLIIDEIALLNVAVLEAIEAACRLISRSEEPFGGKVVIGIGDCRQVAPIVKHAGEMDTFLASVLSWHLWPFFRVLELTQPMRNAQDPDLCAFVDQIGEDHNNRRVRLDNLFSRTDDMAVVQQSLFPQAILSDALICSRRAFLSPLNVLVNDFNETVLQQLPGPLSVLYSYNSVVEDDGSSTDDHVAASQDYLAMIESPEAPNHELRLKQGAICALMRNLSVQKGLVKNQRVVIERITSRWVEVRPLRADHGTGHMSCHLIPRINFDFQPPYTKYTIRRKQFPLRLAYSTTFNSCQGLTLDRVVLDCREDVFAHGQLYTALTRVRHRSHALVFMPESKEDVANVVYKRLLGL